MEKEFSYFTDELKKIVDSSESKEQVALSILKFLQSEYYVLHENDEFEVMFGENVANMGNIARLKLLLDENGGR